MTNFEAFQTCMATLTTLFNRELSEAAMHGYWLGLQDLTAEEFAAATERAASRCRFMPVPAELREFAGRSRNLTAEIARSWDAVRTAVDKHDYLVRSIDFGPLVNAVIRNLGGWDALCLAGRKELDVWMRKEFERVYGALAEVEVSKLHGEALRGRSGGVGLADVRVMISGSDAPRAVSARAAVVRGLAEAKSR